MKRLMFVRCAPPPFLEHPPCRNGLGFQLITNTKVLIKSHLKLLALGVAASQVLVGTRRDGGWVLAAQVSLGEAAADRHCWSGRR